MCLNDSSEKVRDLACMFFTELSKRSNNPVYNLLGDIISILSKSSTDLATSSIPGAPRMSRALTQAEFQSTMTFLLSFVKKDKYVLHFIIPINNKFLIDHSRLHTYMHIYIYII